MRPNRSPVSPGRYTRDLEHIQGGSEAGSLLEPPIEDSGPPPLPAEPASGGPVRLHLVDLRPQQRPGRRPARRGQESGALEGVLATGIDPAERPHGRGGLRLDPERSLLPGHPEAGARTRRIQARRGKHHLETPGGGARRSRGGGAGSPFRRAAARFLRAIQDRPRPGEVDKDAQDGQGHEGPDPRAGSDFVPVRRRRTREAALRQVRRAAEEPGGGRTRH